MVARLAAEEDARRSLIAAVSHDLRTPITALRLLADAIDDDVVDAQTGRGYAARMSTHVRALGALVDDLFELTRLESGDLAWTMGRVCVDALLHETVEAMKPAADARAVTVTAELDASIEAARANPEKLQRVLFNLIQNAIRHTPPDGSVTVRAESVDGGVEIEVADTGPGIAAAHRARLRPVLPGGRCAKRRGRRSRAGGLARDRGSPRRGDLARGRVGRRARALSRARRRWRPGRVIACSARGEPGDGRRDPVERAGRRELAVGGHDLTHRLALVVDKCRGAHQ